MAKGGKGLGRSVEYCVRWVGRAAYFLCTYLSLSICLSIYLSAFRAWGGGNIEGALKQMHAWIGV